MIVGPNPLMRPIVNTDDLNQLIFESDAVVFGKRHGRFLRDTRANEPANDSRQ